MDLLEGAVREGSGYHRRDAVRIRNRTVAPGYCCSDATTGVAANKGGARRSCLCGGWESIFQSTRSALTGVIGNPGRVASPLSIQLWSSRASVGASMITIPTKKSGHEFHELYEIIVGVTSQSD